MTIIGCNKEKKEKEIAILPKVDFTYEVDENNKTVTFTNISEGTKDYIWLFSDGEISNEESPIHSFKTEGSFKIRLNAKIKNTEQKVHKEKTIIIGDEFANRAEMTLKKEEEKDFAGFTIVYDITNYESISKLYIEVSKDKTFSETVTNKEVETLSEKNKFTICNLEPNNTYWYRIAIKYKENTQKRLYYSQLKEISTDKMPQPSIELEIPEYFYSGFYVKTNRIKSNNCSKESIKHKLEVSRSKEFKRGYYAIPQSIMEKGSSFDTEPKTKYYIRYTANYKNVTTKIENTCEVICSYYYLNINIEGGLNKSKSFFGDNIETKKIEDKTIVEITNKNQEKIIFQIKNFKGLGKYKLIYQDENENYGYFLDGKSDKKYYLANKEIYLQVYRQSDKYYYATICNTDSYEELRFKQQKEGNEEVKQYKINNLHFVINR
jgi:hypothetical protein